VTFGRWRAAVPFAVLAVLFGATAALSHVTVNTAAAPTSVAIDVDLRTLVPGIPVSQSTTVEVPVNATVVESAWDQRTGVTTQIAWDVSMCDGATCFDVTPPGVDIDIPAATYEFKVDAVLNAATPYESGRAVGYVRLAEVSALASTGAVWTWQAACLAALALVAGAAALVVARRAS
jgi:hypothetical protein